MIMLLNDNNIVDKISAEYRAHEIMKANPN